MADQDVRPSIEETASPDNLLSIVRQAIEVQQNTPVEQVPPSKQEFPVKQGIQANQAFVEAPKRKRDINDAGDQPMRPWGTLTVGTPTTSTYQSLALRKPLPFGASGTRAPSSTPQVQRVPTAGRPARAIQPRHPLGYTPLSQALPGYAPLSQAPPAWNPLPSTQLQVPQAAPHPAPLGNDRETYINYHRKTGVPHLKLVESIDTGLFHLYQNLNDYEMIIDRHESLANHLGCEMETANLRTALEVYFGGRIQVVCDHPCTGQDHCSPPCWLEVIHLAKTRPELFTVAQVQGVPPVCIFETRGWKCTISEHSWRHIFSGATDFFLSTLKDEHAEVTAIDLIQIRLNHLKDSFNQVATRAHNLKTKLAVRKASIQQRQLATTGFPIYPTAEERDRILQQIHRSTWAYLSPVNITGVPALEVVERYNGPSLNNRVHDTMMTWIQSLPQGQVIEPMCDHCRKLSVACVKDGNTNACDACVKKGTGFTCTWRNADINEVTLVIRRQQARERGRTAGGGPATTSAPGQASSGQAALTGQTQAGQTQAGQANE